MSTEQAPRPAGQDAAVSLYITVGAVALGAICLVLWQRLDGGRAFWVWFPVLIGLLGLVTRWSSAPLMLLLILAGCLHLQSRRALLTDLILSAAVLAYVLSHFRLQSLLVQVFPADPRQRMAPRRPGLLGLLRPTVVYHRRAARLVSPQEVSWFLLALPLWVVAAECGLLLLSRNWGNPGLPGPLWWLVLLTWVVGLGAFLATGFIGFWRRSKMTVEEATLFLQDTYWHETRREQRRINRWLAWARLQRRRKDNP